MMSSIVAFQLKIIFPWPSVATSTSWIPSFAAASAFDGIMHDDRSSISDTDEWLRNVTTVRENWYCESLPPPPYARTHYDSMDGDPAHVTSYTVAGGGGSDIWVSKPNLGTHCFDTVSRAWTKVGDWALPFSGHAQYVPELKLWVGLSSGDDGEIEHDPSVCAWDLAVTPPRSVDIWKDLTSPQWIDKLACLVHLGRSRFCHARFFGIKRPYEYDDRSYVVFTGIEVERRGEAAGGEIGVVKHRSQQYRLFNTVMHWVL